MTQSSQINLLGPAPVAIEMREFMNEAYPGEPIPLEDLLKYLVDYRGFTIGHSPRTSEFYGPYSKSLLLPENFQKIENTYQSLLLEIRNKVIEDYPYLNRNEFEVVFNRLVRNLDFGDEAVDSYLFGKSFFSFEKGMLFDEPIQFDYFISLVFQGDSKSWFVTIWYD